MKRSPLNRYTPLTAKTPWRPERKPLKRRTKIRLVGQSDTALLKEEVQGLVREIVIIRDGGCILRHYPSEAGSCGGYRQDGELVLQGEHLITRSNAASFADTRLIVCLCKYHHIYWKRKYSDDYNALVKRHIGKERTALWDRVKEDRAAHKQDLRLDILALKQELKQYEAR